MPFSGMGRFGFTPRERAEMPCEVGDVVDACEHIKKMSLRNPFSQGLFQLGKVCWCCFRSQPLECRLSFLIDDQFMVLWPGPVYFRSHFC
jgi:hypothetical protein